MTMLSTYVTHPNHAHWLKSYDIHTLIIDCPFCSVRSHDRYDWGNDEIEDVQDKCRPLFMALNLDGLYSSHELQVIESTIRARALDEVFNAFRVQDPGMMVWARAKFPDIAIQFNPETGFQNTAAISSAFTRGAAIMTLNHETPCSTIQRFQDALPQPALELFVQGPICIQYSRRRFLSDLYQSDPNLPIRLTAEDPELPHRTFTFLNTAFGHFMFAQFHRCLAMSKKKVIALGSMPWLIDARGLSEDYAKVAINLYANLATADDATIDDGVRQLEALSNVPQKPGFFLSNQTDVDWRDHDVPKQNDKIGRVLSVKKDDALLIEFFVEIDKGTVVTCWNPDGTTREFVLDDCVALDGGSVERISPFVPLMLPKGVTGIQSSGNLVRCA